MGRNQTSRALTDYIIGTEHKLKCPEVATIVRYFHREWNGVGDPTIDVDASVYLYKFINTKNGPINELAELLVSWATQGVDVTCVLDPLCGVRDHTKRASVKRSSDRNRKRLYAFEAKAKLMRFGHHVQNPGSTPPRDFLPDKAREDIAKLESIIKAAETSANGAVMAEDLPFLLQESLNDLDRPTGSGAVSVIVAKTQADSTIAYRLLHGPTWTMGISAVNGVYRSNAHLSLEEN